MSQILKVGSGGGGGGVTSVPTDSGTATPSGGGVLNIIANHAVNNAGSSVLFTGSGNTVQLNVTDADFNTYVGQDAGNLAATTASLNSSFGFESLQFIDSGSENAAFGGNALNALIDGDNNCAFGSTAGANLQHGTRNLLLGQAAGTQYTTNESNNILLNNTGVTGESFVTRIGDVQTKFYAVGIDGVNVGSTTVRVVSEHSNQLGSVDLVAGSGVAITPTANTITISATNAGDVTSLAGDSGSATPLAGVINVISNIAGNNAGATVEFVGSGHQVQLNVTDAGANTFIGKSAGNLTLTGINNTGLGYITLAALTSGASNVAVGNLALTDLTSGLSNTAIGELTLSTLITGSSNIAIGYASGSSYTGAESENINIDNVGVLGESNVTNIGTSQTIANIAGDVTAYSGSVANLGTFIARSTTNSVQSGLVEFIKYHGSITTPVSSGDVLGYINFAGYDGTFKTGGAAISSQSSGTIANQRVAADLAFATHPDSASGLLPTVRMTINPDGSYQYNSYGAGAIVTDSSGNVTAANGTSGWVLTSTGAGAPTFQAAGSSSITITGDSGGGLTGNSFTFTGGTTGLTFAGASTTETLGGTLVVSNGGTGRASLTNHSLIVGAGTSQVTQLGVATNGQIPIGSTGADPVLATISAGTGISVSNAAGSITISATGTTTLNYTSVNHAASPYTVVATDDYIGVNATAGVVSILLPNAPATGRVYTIKDSNGQAATNNITVTTVGGAVTIDGGTSFVMNTTYESINVLFNGTSYEVY